jgi:dihydrodipicolinate synthase/N-acetylneuraminate lyase
MHAKEGASWGRSLHSDGHGEGLIIQGVFPVMVLPIKEDESIDEEALRHEVDFAIQCGATAVCAPGFATEFYKLTDEERRFVIKIVAEQAQDRVPVFAGTGCGSVHATVELSRYAASAGAAGIMVAAPKWCPLGVPEQTEFFEGVCRGVSIAVMLQDADFTGAGLPASMIVELAERCPNLRYAKLENILPGGKCAEVIRLSGGKVQVLYGMAGVTLMDGLAHGATGVMPGPSFVEAYARVFALYQAGRKTQAASLFYELQPYIAFAIQHLELVIQMDKRALMRRGIFRSDRMRKPSLHLDAAYQAQMDELIESMMKTVTKCHLQ